MVGAGIGSIPALISGLVIGTQRTRNRRREMSFAAFATWLPIAAVLAALGAAIWLIRSLI